MFATPISCVDALSLRCAHSLRCSLCLHSKANVPCLHGASQDLEFAQASKFFLSYYVAEKNIWYSMPENNEEKKQRDVSVSVTTVEFPSELARRVYGIWRSMLLRTRYFEDTSVRVDATKVEFSSAGMYGDTYDPPEAESPAYLIELGRRLTDYCKAPPDKRADAAKSIEIQAKALERYLKTHPPRRGSN